MPSLTCCLTCCQTAIANLYNKVFGSHICSEGRDFMYLKHIETSHVVVYCGRDGLRLNFPDSNLHTKGSSPQNMFQLKIALTWLY